MASCATTWDTIIGYENTMITFSSAPAAITLRKLAENPFDLTASGALTSDRMKQFHTYGSRLHLFYGTERITTAVVEALFKLAQEREALTKMKEMQSGLKINCSEARAVLHTAIRDLSSPTSKSAKNQEAITLAKQELEKLKLFLQEIDRENLFTDVVQIGIGGSCLGPKCISHALQYTAKGRRQAHFLSNIDPDAAAKLLTEINPATTLFIAVSKSGTTMETLTNVYFVSEHLKKCGVNPKNHLISVTEKGSPMDDPKKYRRSFYIWDYIGGRYSVSSMVGAVIISSVTGIDTFMEFLQGAHSMDITALKEDPFYNLPLLSALLNIWNRNFLGFPTKAILPYSEALLYLPAHLQQCDMESNGKRIDCKGNKVPFATGPIIWGEVGTNGQHSFYQLLHQGTDVVPSEFIGFKNSQYHMDIQFEGTSSQNKLLSNLLAQVLALAVGKSDENPNKAFPGNRPSRVLFAKQLDPYTLGALLSYFEHTIAFQGFLWGINSFDQEGVQLGKGIAEQILRHFSREGATEGVKETVALASIIECIEGI